MEFAYLNTIGFGGKPIIDVRSLNMAQADKLSRAQLRDIMYTLRQEKIPWDTDKLKNIVKAIVHSLVTRSGQKVERLENALRIHIPRPGEVFQPPSVPSEKVKPRSYTGSKKMKKGNEKRQCTSCGDMARSVCFYKCCKRCCVQLKNPCTVHVLPASKISDRKGYGDGKVCQVVPGGAFSRTPEVLANAQPRLHDLKENLVAFQEENKEVLEWRKGVMKKTIKAEEEFVAEALDRYERNGALMAKVMAKEDLSKLVISEVDYEKIRVVHAATIEEFSQALKKMETSPPDSAPPALGGKAGPLGTILKGIEKLKSQAEVFKFAETIQVDPAPPKDRAKESNETKFALLPKSSAPAPAADDYVLDVGRM
jgi:hypothetical protein